MNSIHTTFNNSLPSYTAVGGKTRSASSGLSAVVLYRGSRSSRFDLFKELEKCGFDYIISIEGGTGHHDLEILSETFPYVRFILLKEPVSPGEGINIAACELSSPLFFVLWNDLRIIRSGGAVRMAERLLLNALNVNDTINNPGASYLRLCTVPVIQDKRFETLATVSSPVIIKGNFSTLPSIPEHEAQMSIYPFDGAGIYDRERFIRLEGFDGRIKNFYWQLLDFGFRSFLWGEKIAATLNIKLAYETTAPEVDSSYDEDYCRFYLKALAPVFRYDYANLPLRKFSKYLKISKENLFKSWKRFSQGRQWIEANQYCFKSDSNLLIDTWHDKVPKAEEDGSNKTAFLET